MKRFTKQACRENVVASFFPLKYLNIYIYIYIYINIMRGKKDVTTFPNKPVSWIASLFRGLIYIYYIFIIKFGYNARCHWLKERAL